MSEIKKVIKIKPKVEDKKEELVCSNKGLRDIMDKNKKFTMIYSGVESRNYFDILYNLGIRDFLMSFHYIQNKNLNMQQEYGHLGVKFFIDSGAFTYMSDEKYMDKSVEFWEEHLKKYLDWAERNKDMIFAIANFDFEALVGSEVVDRWNREYFEPFMLRTGLPVCFVWHENSPMTWEKYCQRYPFVGFSSANTKGQTIDLKEYVSKLKMAEHYDSLVHGLAI